MPINREFAELHRDMVEVILRRDAAQDWDSPEQRAAADTVQRILWSLGKCQVVPKAGLEYLREEMAKLGPG